jgi:hypothetical protein
MPEDTIHPPLSPVGRARRDAILDAMTRAASSRRRRRTTLRAGAAAAAVAVAVALSVWLALPRPAAIFPPSPIVAVPSVQPDSASPVSLLPSRVVAQFIQTTPGIADRHVAPDPSPLIAVRQVTDTELQNLLAEDGRYGLARIRGRVYVMNNLPDPAESPTETR